jgi:hypothetical protein
MVIRKSGTVVHQVVGMMTANRHPASIGTVAERIIRTVRITTSAQIHALTLTAIVTTTIHLVVALMTVALGLIATVTTILTDHVLSGIQTVLIKTGPIIGENPVTIQDLVSSAQAIQTVAVRTRVVAMIGVMKAQVGLAEVETALTVIAIRTGLVANGVIPIGGKTQVAVMMIALVLTVMTATATNQDRVEVTTDLVLNHPGGQIDLRTVRITTVPASTAKADLAKVALVMVVVRLAKIVPVFLVTIGILDRPVLTATISLLSNG